MTAPKFKLDVLIEAVDKISKPLTNIQKRIDRVTAPVRRLRSSLNKLGQIGGVPQLANGLSLVHTRASGVASELFGIVKRLGAIGAVGGGVLFGLANATSSSGDEIAKLAFRLGISVEKLQEYEFAAERSGVSSEGYRKSLEFLARQLGETRNGQTSLARNLERIDPKLARQAEQVENVEGAFELLLTAIDKAPDDLDRAALAAAAFGRSGAPMINLARNGAEGLAELRAEARRLGLVLDGETARASEGFQDSLLDLKSALLGIRNTIGAALIPIVERAMSVTREWLIENRPQVQAFAAAFAERLPKVLRQVWELMKQLRTAMEPIIDLVRRISDRFGGVNVILGVTAALIGGKLILALGGLVAALGTLSAALVATPIGLIIIGVAALVAGILALRDNWDTISKWFVSTWEWVRDRVLAIVGPIRDAVKGAVGLIPKKIRASIGLDTSSDDVASAPSLPKPPPRSPMVANESTTRVKVEFANAPPGMRPRIVEAGDAAVDLDTGFAMAMP